MTKNVTLSIYQSISIPDEAKVLHVVAYFCTVLFFISLNMCSSLTVAATTIVIINGWEYYDEYIHDDQPVTKMQVQMAN